MTARPSYPLRPFMPADTMALRELFAVSIEELTQEEYDEDQRAAWAASRALDAQAFGKALAGMLTLVVQIDGEYAGFASLKEDRHVEMLYVHPYHAGEGIGTALMDALEKIAAARGTLEITVDSSDTAQPFFEDRGYAPTRRNSVPVDDQWLSNTTMSKKLDKPSKGSP